MPFNAIQEYSTVAGANTDIGGNNIAEGCAPSGINNALRELAAQLRKAVANQGADIASAATTDIGASSGQYVKVTGATAITALGTVNAGTMRFVEFAGSLILTHNATSFILPGGANITTQAGDVGVFASLGSGNWKMLHYMPGNQATRLGFLAHKNGTNQAGIAPVTTTKVSFTTEAIDIGGHYDTTNSRWTPPAGLVRIGAMALVDTNVNDGGTCLIYIFKNGAIHAVAYHVAANNAFIAPQIDCVDVANGTDFYEVYVNLGTAGGGNKTINGGATVTYFFGHRLF